MSFWVYKITNLVNGKAYIGITSRAVRNRWIEHMSQARKEKSFPLYKAIRKYGTANFKVDVLYEASSWTELLVVERGLIAAHGTYGKCGYNVTVGGEGVRGRQLSAEECTAISERNKGRIFTPEQKERMSAGVRRWATTPEGRAKQSTKTKGKSQSPESIAKRVAATRKTKSMKRDSQDQYLFDLEVANVLAV